MTRIQLDMERAVRMLRAGASLPEIADAVGACRATVRKRLVEAGETPPPRGRRPRHRFTPEEIRRHVQQHGGGSDSLRALAQQRGMSRQRLEAHVKRLGGMARILRGEATPGAPVDPPAAESRVGRRRPADEGAVVNGYAHCDAGTGIDDPRGLAAALLRRCGGQP